MIFKFKKTLFFPIFLSFFLFSALAQVEGSFYDNLLGEGEEEVIDCKDLPMSLNSYNQDVQLMQHSIKSTLLEVSSLLKVMVDGDQLNKDEMLRIINDLYEAQALVQANEFNLSTKGSDISYFLRGCLDSSSK